MKCPNCNETLLMMQKDQIEIDYCPSCRGVWLDRGELDKILDQASQTLSYRQGFGKPGKYNPYAGSQHDYDRPHKKRSFLRDLFDFD
jgi:Zn-finger nucleic acid-binding protein